MPPRTAAEHRQIMEIAQTQRDLQQLYTAHRKVGDAKAVLDAARERAIRSIVDTFPILTAEQRERLRPMLAGTIPAEPARADGAA